MKDLIIAIPVLLAMFLYYKFVLLPESQIKSDLDLAALPKDTSNAQDDDFCAIASAISKCKTEMHFEMCIKAIKKFQDKYTDITGVMDVNDLLTMYKKRQQNVMLAL